jgi:hypothetical protein
MRPRNELESLLDDVLREGEPDAFRKNLAERCCRELARKRIPWALLALPVAAVLLFAFLIAFGRPNDHTAQKIPTIPRAEAPAWVVHTKPMMRDRIVTSCEKTSVNMVRTRKLHGFTVRSENGSCVQIVTDREVLDMLPGISCGVVQDWEGEKNLVFLKPQDEERFLGPR